MNDTTHLEQRRVKAKRSQTGRVNDDTQFRRKGKENHRRKGTGEK